MGVKVNIEESLRESARAADREDAEKREACAALVKNPNFLVYTNMLNKMIEDLGMTVLEPAQNLDACVALEGIKGTMRGLIRARDLARVTVATIPEGRTGMEIEK